MSFDFPRRDAVLVASFALASLALLLFMLIRLGTVTLPAGHVRQARALFANAEGLPSDGDVLVHGVKVGSVTGIDVRGPRTLVTLSLGSQAPTLHPDASVQVGFKTALGEPFVDLDPGRAAGRATGLIRARSTAEIDDALGFLDRSGRANARAALIELGRGAAPADTSQNVNQTLGRLQSSTASVGQLAAELRAQRTDLTATVSDGRIVLDVLAKRAAELQTLTADARIALGAVAGQRTALGATLARLPGLITTADSTLRSARPLIAKATPLATEIATASPSITSALRATPATTSALEALLAQAASIRTAVTPALELLRGLATPASASLELLGPVLADIVPVAQYLGPRGHTIAAWFANTADLGSHGDAKGDWARFFVGFDPSTLTGTKYGAAPGNSYTAPGDAAHNEPYKPGSYPQLMPYAPALGKR
jgi:phospholipid/cholesterol/gamma-HCH transport system substrate-binding protein